MFVSAIWLPPPRCSYITIELVGAAYCDRAAVSEKILDLEDDDISEAEIIGHLLASDLLDENANVHAGRIALRSYCFVEDGNDVSCNQVAGVGVEEAFQKKGISSRAYLFLLNWFEHLVCDDTQTIPGAKFGLERQSAHVKCASTMRKDCFLKMFWASWEKGATADFCPGIRVC